MNNESVFQNGPLGNTPLIDRLATGPVLCWVCNRHSDKADVRLVYQYVNGLFCDKSGIEFWPFSRPLSADDVAAFLMVFE